MRVYIIDWTADDIDGKCEIIGIGKDHDANTVAIRVTYEPAFFVAIPVKSAFSPVMRKSFMYDAKETLGARHTSLEPRRGFVGFSPDEPQSVVKARFSSLKSFRRAKYITRDKSYRTYEATVDPIIKFFHQTGIDPVGWVEIENEVRVDNLVSKPYVHEYEVVSYLDITKPETPSPPPPLKIASFDLECYSSTGKFPDGSIPYDKVISIGTTYAIHGEQPMRQTIHQLDACNDIPNVDVHVWEDERSLINAWLREIEGEQVDVICGYNIWGFDWKYLDDRTMVLIDLVSGESSLEMSRLGHLRNGGGARMEKKLASAAYGSNSYIYLNTPGITQLDLLAIFRKELKLDSYTLDNVSKTYLGTTKLDVSAKQMFTWYKEQDVDGLSRMAEYCVRDTELPLQLIDKLNVLTNQIEMANVVGVPLPYLNTRGQQIRCFSLITKHANMAGYVVDDMEKAMDRDGYVGATVLEPVRGAFVHDVVTCLDFASLYPSIMRAHTMCPSTIVLDDRYNEVEGMEYYRIETTPGHIVSFAQTDRAVVPKLLADLAMWRKEAKRAMATADDPFQKSLQNARQLAYKVAMNSIYGFFGAAVGNIPLIDLASAVTSTGRDMILRTKKACEERGHKVVYGDSVAAYTPIHIRLNGVYELTTFELLAMRLNWTTRADGKEEAAVPNGLETWSDKGWTPVLNVIRHVHTDPLVRVCTHTGVVDVTHDHSLLRPDGQMVKPSEVNIGDSLMHAPLPNIGKGTIPCDMDSSDQMGYETQLSCARLYSMYVSAGYSVSISSSVDKPDIFGLTASRQKLRRQPHTIEKMCEVQSTHYVYDFTTANHHFSAGIGEIVVHNTDSVFTVQNLGEKNRLDIEKHIESGKVLADELTRELFKHPNELEYEKVYTPFLLFAKKRYAAQMFEFDPSNPTKIDVKGLQLVRRDSPPFVRRIMQRVLHIIMTTRSFDQALEYAKKSIKEIVDNKVPFDEFVVSKAVRSGYANPDSLPHVQVARKRRERGRDPPAEGERVPFVIIRSLEHANDLIAARAEDPVYVKENNLDLDVLYYINNCLLKPMEQIFELVFKDVRTKLLADIAEEMLRLQTSDIAERRESKRLRFLKDTKQREITSFFKKKM
jgi:DNA polymerase elongation subunit (family B)